MLSPEEMQSLAINEHTAREAFDLGQKRLTDNLETKKAHDQKATVLFSAFVTASLALVGVGGTLLRDPSFRSVAPMFFVCALFFIAAAAFCAACFYGRDYGSLGASPSSWLRKGVIDGSDAEMARVFAYLAHEVEGHINTSRASNRRKHACICRAIWIAAIGALVFAVSAWWAISATA